MEHKEKLISTFNESALQIQRIGNDLVEAKYHRKKGRLIKYRFILETIEDELYYDAKKLDKNIKEESEKYLYNLKEINKSIDLSILSKDFSKFYQDLRKKERLLREIQQECGKGASYKSADEDELD